MRQAVVGVVLGLVVQGAQAESKIDVCDYISEKTRSAYCGKTLGVNGGRIDLILSDSGFSCDKLNGFLIGNKSVGAIQVRGVLSDAVVRRVKSCLGDI